MVSGEQEWWVVSGEWCVQESNISTSRGVSILPKSVLGSEGN